MAATAMTRTAPARTWGIAITAMLALVVTTWLAVPAGADEVACTGSIGAQTVDDVRVPDGESCTLSGTRVEGNVLVGTGSRLTAAGVDVDGNIQAEGSAQVDVTDSTVGGNVQLEQGGGATVRSTVVDGDIQVGSNAAALTVDGNDVGGNVQAFSNTGGVSVSDNTVDGNLQCKSNDPAPTGGDNVVRGNAEDQCASLSDAPDAPGDTETLREIGRISGADRYATAVEISKETYAGGAPVVYLARSDVAVDAMAGKSLTDGPILLVPSCGQLPSVVAGEISRLDPARVVALGGSGAICDQTLTEAGNVR